MWVAYQNQRASHVKLQVKHVRALIFTAHATKGQILIFWAKTLYQECYLRIAYASRLSLWKTRRNCVSLRSRLCLCCRCKLTSCNGNLQISANCNILRHGRRRTKCGLCRSRVLGKVSSWSHLRRRPLLLHHLLLPTCPRRRRRCQV